MGDVNQLMKERLQELMEKGKQYLNRDGVNSVQLTYCPICDETEWYLYSHKSDDLKKIGNLDSCYENDHIKYFINQEFCGYHKESWEIETILKYKEIKERLKGDNDG